MKNVNTVECTGQECPFCKAFPETRRYRLPIRFLGADGKPTGQTTSMNISPRLKQVLDELGRKERA